MCGIAGIFGGGQGLDLRNTALAMANNLGHRGPDSGGVWVSQDDRIALSHRRLSILDLTATGHQPMITASGRYVISFNGEIYNHNNLRNELNSNWVGSSDTETLLAAIEEWGLHEALNRCVGMFAFAIWDNQKKTISLARDRFGEKPLFYTVQNDTLIFSSELRSFGACRDFKFDIDIDSVRMYLAFGYVAAPKSIYANVYKIESGTYATFEINNNSNENPQILRKKEIRYWSRKHEAEKMSKKKLFDYDINNAKNELHDALKKSVKGQMNSDVPLGAFLSGGTDSTLIVALMKEVSNKNINTFTIGFEEKKYDESSYASKVAKYLGVNHHELIMTSNSVLKLIPDISLLVDEPFADVSIIPTYLISKYAKEHVNVVLSGDGGDELFGGYSRYLYSKTIFKIVQNLPIQLRKMIAAASLKIPTEIWDELNQFSKVFFRKDFYSDGNIVHKGINLIRADSRISLYLQITRHWDDIDRLLLKRSKGVIYEKDKFEEYFEDIRGDLSEQMMSADIDTYLQDDILVKLDRASMATGLEARVPFLDINVFNVSCKLPIEMKIRGRKGKLILRELLYEYVPREILERPKTGFGVPIGEWLRGPLKGWANSLLDKNKINSAGIFNSDEICKKWKEHLSGKLNWEKPLWNILMFQVWLENNKL